MSPISDKEGQVLRFELERFLSYEKLFELAKITGFCKRIRKLHPIIFLQMIIFSPCLHLVTQRLPRSGENMRD